LQVKEKGKASNKNVAYSQKGKRETLRYWKGGQVHQIQAYRIGHMETPGLDLFQSGNAIFHLRCQAATFDDLILFCPLNPILQRD
jgi:hypothetical protein